RTDNRGSADPRHRDALHVPVHIFVSHYRHSHCPPVLGVSARCCGGSIHQFLQKLSDHGGHTTALRAWGRAVFGRRLASPTIGGGCPLSGGKRTLQYDAVFLVWRGGATWGIVIRLAPHRDDLRPRRNSCNVFGRVEGKLKHRFTLHKMPGARRWEAAILNPAASFGGGDAKRFLYDFRTEPFLAKTVEHVIKIF